MSSRDSSSIGRIVSGVLCFFMYLPWILSPCLSDICRKRLIQLRTFCEMFVLHSLQIYFMLWLFFDIKKEVEVAFRSLSFYMVL